MVNSGIIIAEDDPADERVREQHDPFLLLHEAVQMRVAFLILSPDEGDFFYAVRVSFANAHAEPGLLLQNADELPVGFSLMGLCGEAKSDFISTRDGEPARARLNTDRDPASREESFAEAFPAIHARWGMGMFVFYRRMLSAAATRITFLTLARSYRLLYFVKKREIGGG